MKRLEVVGSYPEDGDEQHGLRQQQAAQPDECKGMEKTTHGTCLLIAPEQEVQCHEECGGRQVSGIQCMNAGTDGYQQDIDGGLYRCPHADKGERIVELYQEITDDGIQNKTCETIGPSGDA